MIFFFFNFQVAIKTIIDDRQELQQLFNGWLSVTDQSEKSTCTACSARLHF